MKRRSFLKLMGFGLVAPILPSVVLAEPAPKTDDSLGSLAWLRGIDRAPGESDKQLRARRFYSMAPPHHFNCRSVMVNDGKWY